MSRFMEWLFYANPKPSRRARRLAEVAPEPREPHWYEKDQIGEGNLDEHGRLKPEILPPQL